MMYRARLAPRSSMTPSSDSTHSAVSSGSMSGSWLGRPSLITGRLRSLATGVPSSRWRVAPILPRAGTPRHLDATPHAPYRRVTALHTDHTTVKIALAFVRAGSMIFGSPPGSEHGSSIWGGTGDIRRDADGQRRRAGYGHRLGRVRGDRTHLVRVHR